MKVGICINGSRGDDMAQKFDMAAKEGFDNCQLLSWDTEFWTDENAAEIKACVEKYGVEITAFWCGWEGPVEWNFYEGQLTLGLVPEEYREMRIKNLCDGAHFALKMGVTDVITHVGFIPENPFDPQYDGFCAAVKRVAQHLKKNGQRFLFETGQETPVAILRCFESVGEDNLGVNLDTANLILYGKANPVDSLDVFGKYVYQVHAKDGMYPVNGRELGEEVRLGDGKVDFPKLIERLKELGYEGSLTIEREIEDSQEDIKYAKVYLESILGGDNK